MKLPGWSPPPPYRRGASPAARPARCRPGCRRSPSRISPAARRSPCRRPRSVSASLSRVCEAGSSDSVSIRLSRISACASLASPCTTLIRSNTTRRSAPITRSRLRKPTSKSITTTFSPPLRQRGAERGGGGRLADAALAGRHHQDLGHLRLPLQSRTEIFICSPSSQACTGLPQQLGGHVVGGLVDAVDRQ